MPERFEPLLPSALVAKEVEHPLSLRVNDERCDAHAPEVSASQSPGTHAALLRQHVHRDFAFRRERDGAGGQAEQPVESPKKREGILGR